MTKHFLKKFIFIFLVFVFSFDFALAQEEIAPLEEISAPITLSSISISNPASKLSYTIGEEFSLDGLVVSGLYSDGSQKEEIITVSNISGFDSFKPVNGQVITVSLEGKTVTYSVDIIPKVARIHLNVVSSSGIVLDTSFDVYSCDSDMNENTIDVLSGYCAIQQSGLNADWSWYGEDAFLNSINTIENNKDGNGVYWGWFSNLELGNLALNKYSLKEGDSLLLNYGINPLKLSVDNSTPNAGDTITFSLTEFGYDDSWNPAWKTVSGGNLLIGENTFVLDENGNFEMKVKNSNSFSVIGKKSGSIDSKLIQIQPVASNSNIVIRNGNLIVYEGIYDLPKEGDVSLLDKNGESHSVNGRSVIAILSQIDEQSEDFSLSNLEYNLGLDALYVKCITPVSSSELCDNWQYVVNGSYPYVGMDKNILDSNQKIYIFFGDQNRILLNKDSLDSTETLIVTSEKYNYENNTWQVRSGVTVGVTVPDPLNPWSPNDSIKSIVDPVTGIAFFSSLPVGSYDVGIKEDYYWPTKKVTVTLQTVSTGGGSQSNFSIPLALEFLRKNQKSDGSFGSSLYTDWASFAVVAGEDSSMKSSLISYISSHPLSSSVVTDNERRAMALMVLGINPYTGTGINYIEKITQSFDGVQFGDSSLINDDIFALIVLKNAGYVSSDEIIKKDVAYIISVQGNDGSWGSVDMTAAGIEALRNFNSVSGASSSIDKAEKYLVASQSSDGSFSNSFSTTWALKALSLNSTYSEDSKKAESYLGKIQQKDGGFDLETLPIDSRVWVTSYAVPALLNKSWNSLMQDFEKPKIVNTDLSVTENNTTDSLVEEIKEVVENQVLTNVVKVDLPVKKQKVEQIKKEIIPETEISLENDSNLTASVGDIPFEYSLFKKFLARLLDSIKNMFSFLPRSFAF